MSSLPSLDRHFFAVPIVKFRAVERALPFDIFIRIAKDHYACIFSKTTGLDFKRISDLMSRGVNQLHLRHEDKDLYGIWKSESSLQVYDRHTEAIEKRITALLNVTEQNLSEIFYLFPLWKETVDQTREVVKRYVQLVSESPLTLARILSLVSRGDYLYFHSIAVSVLSIFVAQSNGIRGAALEEIGLAGFLHDLGFSRMEPEYKEMVLEIDEHPSAEIQSHVELGVSILQEIPDLSKDLLQIIAHHHERPDGRGFPFGLKEKDIHFGSQILSACDMWSTLMSKQSGGETKKPREAIAWMKAQKGRFNTDVIQSIESVFLDVNPAKKKSA